jgi:cellulose/xylan binding protein with CBM9 domain
MLSLSRIVLALLGALAPMQRLAEPEASPLRCRLSPGRLVIDGILDEACWREADVATGFVLLERGGRATQQTQCMVAYDAESLYVAFLCLESDPSGVRALRTARDGAVWLDDCVEVFLDTQHSRRKYFHVITNCIGTRFDEVGPPCPNPTSWDAPWFAATHAAPGGWSVEIAIPFRSLGVEMPLPGTLWGFNAHRQEYRLMERSSWSATLHSFHEPWNFGDLLFVPQS